MGLNKTLHCLVNAVDSRVMSSLMAEHKRPSSRDTVTTPHSLVGTAHIIVYTLCSAVVIFQQVFTYQRNHVFYWSIKEFYFQQGHVSYQLVLGLPGSPSAMSHHEHYYLCTKWAVYVNYVG